MKQLRSRKHHAKEFRRQAVELLLTGRTLRELAAELNVGVSTLQEWKLAVYIRPTLPDGTREAGLLTQFLVGMLLSETVRLRRNDLIITCFHPPLTINRSSGIRSITAASPIFEGTALYT